MYRHNSITGAYSTLAYYLGRAIADTPFQFVFPILFGAIVYWLVGYQSNFARFLVFLAALVVIANVAQALGYVLNLQSVHPLNNNYRS